MGNRTGIRIASASSIQIDFTYRGVRCREKLRMKPSKANLAYAERKRGEVLNAIERGTFVYTEFFPNSATAARLSPLGYSRTVGEALDLYLKSSKTELQRSTYLDYRNSVINILQPAFGDIPLGRITRAEIKAWIAGLTVTKKRISNILLPLRAVLTDALVDNIITTNPLFGWTPKVKESGQAQPRINPFNLDEIRNILDAASGEIKNLLEFGFWTGLRISELIAVRWEDVEDDILNIRRAKVAGEIKPPKTSSGLRAVKLLRPAHEALRRQKEKTYLMQDWIFLAPDGDPWRGDGQLRNVWSKVLKKADVDYRSPQQMRHTYASLLCSAGENVHWIANQMGHSDTTMVGRVYGKWIPDADPFAGSKAEALWRTSA